MDTQRWERAGSIFERVLGVPVEKRKDLLETLCGDDIELKDVVLSMIDSEDSVPAFAKEFATRHGAKTVSVDPPSDPDGVPVGRRVGPWLLVRCRNSARSCSFFCPAIVRSSPVSRIGNKGRAMTERERRRVEGRPPQALKRELNEAQKIALAELERFGWELKFIRRPMFEQPVPVVFDSSRKHFAVLNDDGTLNEKPGFSIRR